MKRRLSAILLAVGLSVSALSMGVCAAETETEQVTEAMTEAVAEESEKAAAPSQEEQAKAYLDNILSTVSGWSEEEVDKISTGEDPSSASIATNWTAVRGELGNYEELTSIEISEDGLALIGHASYENAAESTDVVVTYSVDQKNGTFKVEWDVIESFGTKMQKAGLNTLMGVGIVFLALLFLSLLIGQLHIIPDMIEGRAKKNAPAPAPTPAPVQTAPVVEEEDLTDDLELVAVITAAIAASENTSSDGFVVRSIKKANKRNWQRA